jgi:hypothetical protein
MILIYKTFVSFYGKIRTELVILINDTFAGYPVSLLRQDWKECAL